jgi:hypothetical protein
MRVLLWISIVLGLGWSGYWFVGRGAVERGAEAFFAAAPAQGLEASHAGLAVRGFPNRFDLTVTEPRIADQGGAFRWQAPFVQLLSLSYRPWHVIAAFAPEQRLTLGAMDFLLDSAKLQASVVVTPNTRLALDRTTLVGDELALSSAQGGWTVRATELRLASRSLSDLGDQHQIGLEAKDLRPDAEFSAGLGGLPARIDTLRLDAVLALTAPLDRFAGEVRPQITQIDLRDAQILWGQTELLAKGQVTVSAGTPEGRIDLTLRGWRQIVPALVASGIIRPELAQTAERMLEALALQSGDAEVLNLPLILAGGQMRLGPLPLGPAPRL